MAELFGQKSRKKIPDLEPLIGEGDGVLQKEEIDPKVVRRAKSLKKLFKAKNEVHQDRTIRLGDKKSASSFSLLFPGLGQLYMGQISLGLAFIFSNVVLLLMYLFLGGILTMSTFSNSWVPAYDYHVILMAPLAIAILSCISIHMAFGLYPEFKLTELIAANRKNNLYWLALIFPGYGQILNGQPRKAITFTFLGILGVFSAVSIFFIYSINWYEYTEALGVSYVEKSLIVLATVLTFSIGAYVLSVFDAFVVSKYPYLKRPPLNRLKRYLGIGKVKNDKTPYRQSSIKFVAVSLLLLFFLFLHLNNSFYKNFYSNKISYAKSMLKEKGMVIIPGMIDELRVPDRLESVIDNFKG